MRYRSSCSVTVPLWLLLGLGLFYPNVVSQGSISLSPCNFSPASSFRYNASADNITICPTAGRQDSIIDSSQNTNSSYTYTILSGSPDVQVCTTNGRNIVIRTSNSTGTISERGSILVTGGVTTYKINYAPTGVYMIDQQPVLEVGMNIKVFELYGDPPSVPTVCEVMDGGDLREINSLIVSVLPSLVCEIATSGTTLGQSRPYRIILSTSSSAIIGDVNLVITSNGCSSTASRLTPEFSLTLVNSTPATPTQQTETTALTTSMTTQPTDVGLIIGAVVGVFLFALVVVAILVALVIVAYIVCKKRPFRPNDGDRMPMSDLEKDNLGKTTPSFELANVQRANGVAEAMDTSLSKGIDDRDSGVESQGPSTPLKKNSIAVLYNKKDDWHIGVETRLADKFSASHTPLVISDYQGDENSFQRTLHLLLGSKHFSLLCIICENQLPVPDFSSGQTSVSTTLSLYAQVVHTLKSCPCPWPDKVCFLQLGTTERFYFKNPYHCIGLTEMPGVDGFTSEDCAEIIYEKVHENTKQEDNVVSKSATHISDWNKVDDPTLSCPLPRSGTKPSEPAKEKSVTDTFTIDMLLDLKTEIKDVGSKVTQIGRAIGDAKDEVVHEIQKGAIDERDGESDHSQDDA